MTNTAQLTDNLVYSLAGHLLGVHPADLTAKQRLHALSALQEWLWSDPDPDLDPIEDVRQHLAATSDD